MGGLGLGGRHLRLQRTAREANSGKRATLVVQQASGVEDGEESHGQIFLVGFIPLEPLGAFLHTFLTTVPAVLKKKKRKEKKKAAPLQLWPVTLDGRSLSTGGENKHMSVGKAANNGLSSFSWRIWATVTDEKKLLVGL